MAVCIEFGSEIAVFLFLFNLLACFCQYLSVHIAFVRNRTLAQICCTEYGKVNNIFLGIQQQVSMIMSDLAMVLGTALGLNSILRVNLFSAVILAALDAFLYPFFSVLLVRPKAVRLLIQLTVLISLSYVLVMLIGLPEKSVSYTFVPSKSIGDNFYALMSLLGANVMPHNFYLHSSFLQRFQRSSGGTRARVAYYNLYIRLAIFVVIFLLKYMLMNSADDVLYSSFTSEDAMPLIQQPISFFLLITFSHISGLSWDLSGEGRQTMLYDFFRIDIPFWLHRVVVRIFVIISALCALRYSGAEGMYQMLISTQVMVALLLPASLVSLYRIASCGALMGVNTISSAMEFFMMMSSMAIIGLQFLFLGEMVFGDDGPYSILLFSCCISIFFTFRLFVTPLRTQVRRFNVMQRQRYVRAFQNERREKTVNGGPDVPKTEPKVEERDLVTRISNPKEASKQAFRIVQANELNEVENSFASFLSLTRTARTEMAAILNEFWGQLYDYNGQFTQAAKAKKLHLMFGGSVGSHLPRARFHVYESRGLYGLDSWSVWAKQPFEQFDVANKICVDMAVSADSVVKLLWSFRRCILKLMRVKGSKWMFRQTDVVDEELVRRVAAKERYLYKADPDHKVDFSVPNCGESCVWKADLIVSFGVWCIRRVLELSLDEYYPELWREYTFVLNRLQGMVDVACSNKRKATQPCICLELEPGKKTTAPMLMKIIKDTQTILFSKKTNSSTAMAFSMERGNLVSILQRYKRNLSEPPSNPAL